MLYLEIIILCTLFFILCYLGTGTDEKNLRSYDSYPNEVQKRIREIDEYNGKFKERNVCVTFFSNLVLFLVLFFIIGFFIRGRIFAHNFLKLFILGQALNTFDLVFIDLIWWRNAKRIRLSKIPQKELYQNPRKHIDSFLRATIMYTAVAAIDGYLLTLF